MLKELKINLPLLSVFVIILSLIKQILFYRGFSIPIYYFISFSELPAFISEDLILICFGFATGIIMQIIFNAPAFKNSNEPLFGKKEERFAKVTRVDDRISLVVIVVSSIVLYFIAKKTNQYYITVSSFIFPISMLGFFLVYKLRRLMIEKNIISAISAAIILLAFVIGSASFDVYKVEHGYYKGTTISRAESFVSNDSIFYIGKTNGYLFVHDNANKITEVIPMGEIKSLKIRIN